MPRRMIPRYIAEYGDQSATYAMFNPEGRLHVVCPQCRALVLLCDSLPRTERQKIVGVATAKQATDAMEMLKNMLPCSDREAKAIVSHLRKADEGCSHCKADLPRGSLLCPHCWSVNLDWS